jgi:signal peptidase I
LVVFAIAGRYAGVWLERRIALGGAPPGATIRVVSDPSPYAPSAALAAERPAPDSPPRWLAVLGSLITAQPFLGAGLWILGRRRRALVWAALGLVETGAMIATARAGAPRLFLLAWVVMVASVIAGLIDTSTARRDERSGSVRGAVLFVVALFIVARGTVLAARLWGYEMFRSPTSTMAPTILAGDHFMVRKGHAAVAGDVITFQYPLAPEVEYVKRVAAVGGDTIELRRDVVYVNGQAWSREPTTIPCLAAPAPPQDCKIWNEGGHLIREDDHPPIDIPPTTVPRGTVYVLADDRHNGHDSRIWGPVPIPNIKGKAVFIAWSSARQIRWSRIGQIIH